MIVGAETREAAICDGMPCNRRGGTVRGDKSDALTTWDYTECMHESYWEKAIAFGDSECISAYEIPG